MSLPWVKQSTTRLKTASTQKERRLVVRGDSLLRRTVGPAFQPDPTRTELRCLHGERGRDLARKLLV